MFTCINYKLNNENRHSGEDYSRSWRVLQGVIASVSGGTVKAYGFNRSAIGIGMEVVIELSRRSDINPFVNIGRKVGRVGFHSFMCRRYYATSHRDGSTDRQTYSTLPLVERTHLLYWVVMDKLQSLVDTFEPLLYNAARKFCGGELYDFKNSNRVKDYFLNAIQIYGDEIPLDVLQFEASQLSIFRHTRMVLRRGKSKAMMSTPTVHERFFGFKGDLDVNERISEQKESIRVIYEYLNHVDSSYIMNYGSDALLIISYILVCECRSLFAYTNFLPISYKYKDLYDRMPIDTQYVKKDTKEGMRLINYISNTEIGNRYYKHLVNDVYSKVFIEKPLLHINLEWFRHISGYYHLGDLFRQHMKKVGHASVRAGISIERHKCSVNYNTITIPSFMLGGPKGTMPLVQIITNSGFNLRGSYPITRDIVTICGGDSFEEASYLCVHQPIIEELDEMSQYDGGPMVQFKPTYAPVGGSTAIQHLDVVNPIEFSEREVGFIYNDELYHSIKKLNYKQFIMEMISDKWPKHINILNEHNRRYFEAVNSTYKISDLVNESIKICGWILEGRDPMIVKYFYNIFIKALYEQQIYLDNPGRDFSLPRYTHLVNRLHSLLVSHVQTVRLLRSRDMDKLCSDNIYKLLCSEVEMDIAYFFEIILNYYDFDNTSYDCVQKKCNNVHLAHTNRITHSYFNKRYYSTKAHVQRNVHISAGTVIRGAQYSYKLIKKEYYTSNFVNRVLTRSSADQSLNTIDITYGAHTHLSKIQSYCDSEDNSLESFLEKSKEIYTFSNRVAGSASVFINNIVEDSSSIKTQEQQLGEVDIRFHGSSYMMAHSFPSSLANMGYFSKYLSTLLAKKGTLVIPHNYEYVRHHIVTHSGVDIKKTPMFYDQLLFFLSRSEYERSVMVVDIKKVNLGTLGEKGTEFDEQLSKLKKEVQPFVGDKPSSTVTSGSHPSLESTVCVLTYDDLVCKFGSVEANTICWRCLRHMDKAYRDTEGIQIVYKNLGVFDKIHSIVSLSGQSSKYTNLHVNAIKQKINYDISTSFNRSSIEEWHPDQVEFVPTYKGIDGIDVDPMDGY